jgi:hypothetical protein
LRTSQMLHRRKWRVKTSRTLNIDISYSFKRRHPFVSTTKLDSNFCFSVTTSKEDSQRIPSFKEPRDETVQQTVSQETRHKQIVSWISWWIKEEKLFLSRMTVWERVDNRSRTNRPSSFLDKTGHITTKAVLLDLVVHKWEETCVLSQREERGRREK